MKLKAIFEYNDFIIELINFAEENGYNIKSLHEKIENTIFFPELYKEFTRIEKDIDSLRDDSEHKEEIFEILIKFMDNHKIESVYLTESISEIMEI